MSTIKSILIMVLLVLIIYIIVIKPQIIKKIPLLSNIYNMFVSFPSIKSSNIMEKFHLNNLETTEESNILLTSPTINPLEARQLLHMKNSLIKPFTNIGTHPDTNHYQRISSLDFKNIQMYLSNLLSKIVHEKINYKIVPEFITPNIFCAVSTNLLFITPIEIKGKLYINHKLFGDININFMMKGSTNTVYVPKNGIFVNNKKYEMYIDNVIILSIKKINSPEYKQNGFYATADNIDMRVTDDTNDITSFNKTPQQINNERKKEIPMKTFAELEGTQDTEDYLNLSEIINENMSDEITY
ncbi:hypothetical protein crov310 [Cafeteria roenbergensis virus]|uniref:Uncharacterized protein n=1 Tax=Cafeteria roenbergensis virus (strain BV-PW1) TaxID=693272 RepID=E3T581_CROVB|nr:hypothetical protein crov310 [Cafeteria roenbergensis virus BV-PW1]ADO67344.1 hypothetical protein crov310 [Cafeteria roenbergensis virus BV-PW1]